MFDSRKELLDNIHLGESTFLECKEVRFRGGRVSAPNRDALADGLAAFANSRGGVFVLGVEDRTREVIGIPIDRLDTVVDFVRHVCIDSVEPPIECVVLERLRLSSSTGEELAVVKVYVPRSLFVHRSPNGYLLRTADSTRCMSPEYLARLFQQRSQTRLIRFDEQTVPGARLDDLALDLRKRFLTQRSDEDRTIFLRKLGMVGIDADGEVKPTVAGILMASKDPRDWLPNAFIQAVAYRGDSIRPSTADAYQLDAMDISGPLDRQIVEACRFVFRNMKKKACKGGDHLGRVDRPQYDITAVFEAIVNAAAHRDYSVHGSKIRLQLFANRLELYSPGAIVNSLTIDSLRYRQAARNETVCSLLTKCAAPDEPWLSTDRRNLMEKRGEGVPIILDGSERLSGRTPEYRLIDDAELLLTIHAAFQ